MIPNFSCSKLPEHFVVVQNILQIAFHDILQTGSVPMGKKTHGLMPPFGFRTYSAFRHRICLES